MDFLINIIGFIVLLFTIRPITVLIHELGHGIPALLLTKEKVTIYIGSYGDPEKSLNFSLGRLEFFFKYNLFYWESGLCVPDSMDVDFNQQIIIVLFGPLFSLFFGFFIFYLGFNSEIFEKFGFICTLFFCSTILDFYINIVPNHEPIRLHNGTIIYNDGQRLKQLFKFKTYPKQYKEGVNFYNEQAYGKAASAFQQVIDSGIQDDTVSRLLITSFLQLKKFEKADQLFQEFENDFEMTSDDYTNVGYIKTELQKGDLGLEAFNKALDLNPENRFALNNRGYLYILDEQFEKAIADLDKAIQLDPKFSYAYCNRGLAKIKCQDQEAAFRDIMTAIDLDSKNSYAFRNLGIYFFENKDYVKALENFEKAYELDDSTLLINDYIRLAKEKISSLS